MLERCVYRLVQLVAGRANHLANPRTRALDHGGILDAKQVVRRMQDIAAPLASGRLCRVEGQRVGVHARPVAIIILLRVLFRLGGQSPVRVVQGSHSVPGR